MENLLTTERLTVRPFNSSREDADFVLRLLNSEGWLAFIGDRGIKTKEQAKAYVEERFLSKYGTTHLIMYAVDLNTTGETMGMCGLVQRDYLDHPDIGYAFLPEYFGQGYAREAAIAMLNYASHNLGFEKLYAIVTPRNQRSISLLEKIGFTFKETKEQNGEPVSVFEKYRD